LGAMLSARFYAANEKIRVEEVPVPAVGDDDVEVQVKAAGVCHSDLHTINGRQTARVVPIALGHEGSGVVVATGKNVKNVAVGDRVGIDYIWSCGQCGFCIAGKTNLCDKKFIMSSGVEGTWRERIVAPSRHVHVLPANISFAEGAILNCAVMTGYHAAKLAETKPGVSVLVYGLGGVGMNVLKWSKIAGAAEIIAVDQDEERLRIAKREGATSTINPTGASPVDEIKRLTGGGVDIGFEVIGKVETYRNTLSSVKKGGKAVLIGMCWEPFPIHVLKDLQFGERRIISPEDHTKPEIYEVLRLIETNRFQFGDAITHKFPLKEVNEAVNVLQNRIGNPGRVILEP
jgi:alcohol dehydrogenase, propanol-preferring